LLTNPQQPGRVRQRIRLGAPADLCLLDALLTTVLSRQSDPAAANPVRATFLSGCRAYPRSDTDTQSAL